MAQHRLCILLAAFASSASWCAGVASAGGASFPQPVVLLPGYTDWSSGYPEDLYATTLVVADANGDGLPELIIGTSALGMMIATSEGTFDWGRFDRVGESSPGVDVQGLAAADVDGDGDMDLAASRGTGVSVLLGAGDGSFPSELTEAVGQYVGFDLACLDADLDGNLDLLVPLNNPGGLRVLLGNGSGDFVPQPSLATVATPCSLAVGDVDNDGIPDVALNYFPGFTEIGIAAGLGHATFAAPQEYPAAGAVDVALADVDADGWLDLAWCSTVANVQLSAGGGAFGPSITVPGTGPGWFLRLQAGDLDEDGDADLLASRYAAINDGDGQLAADPAGAFALPGGVNALVLTDLDGDAVLDVAASCGELVVLARGTLGPEFESEVSTTVSAVKAESRFLADLDADGADDVVLSDKESVHVCLGVGDGHFEPPLTSSTSDDPLVLCTARAAGDFDGDGQLDLLAVFEPDHGILPHGVRVLHGLGDGTVAQGESTVVGGSVISGFAAADLDADGDLDSLAANGTVLNALLNGGAGTFSVAKKPIGTTLSVLATGDVNADGVPDAAAIAGDAVLVLQGLGDGTFAAPDTLSSFFARGLAVGDVDGDGLNDVATGGGSDSPSGAGVTVWRSLPGWGFDVLGVVGPFGSSVWTALAAGDLTGDGLADVLVGDTSSSLAVISANGRGGLAEPNTYLNQASSSAAQQRLAGHIDGDALLDVVTVVPQVNELSYHASLSQPGATWQNLGGALPGAHGSPLLGGSGALQAHSPLQLSLTHAAAGAATWLIVGPETAMLPFKGGTLVPAPALVLAGLATDGQGALALSGLWPDGVPSGATFVLQAWITDAAGPAGFAASNGLLLAPH